MCRQDSAARSGLRLVEPAPVCRLVNATLGREPLPMTIMPFPKVSMGFITSFPLQVLLLGKEREAIL